MSYTAHHYGSHNCGRRTTADGLIRMYSLSRRIEISVVTYPCASMPCAIMVSLTLCTMFQKTAVSGIHLAVLTLFDAEIDSDVDDDEGA